MICKSAKKKIKFGIEPENNTLYNIVQYIHLLIIN